MEDRCLRAFAKKGRLAGKRARGLSVTHSSEGNRLTNSVASAGKAEIESTEDARKRGQSSPDRVEAQVMTSCKIVQREHTVVFGERVVISQF